MAEPLYWIWLQQALGAGASQAEALLEQFASVKAVFEAEEYPESLELTRSQRQRLLRKDLQNARRELDGLRSLGAFVLTPDDSVFRTLFEGMYAPPTVIYGLGERFDPRDVMRVTVVDTRHADDNSVKATRRIAAGLAAGGAVLISGGAEGLDEAAMRAALDEGGRVISFQACGLDVDYPKSTAPLRERLLQNGGMLLTEFPLGATVRTYHFPIRNRLMAAASFGTLVTAAPKRSGALMTARWARDMGRDVFALPGTVGVACCEGSNELLKDGAIPVTAAADILMTYAGRVLPAVDIEAAIAAEERAANPTRQAAATLHPVNTVLRVAQETAEPVPCPDGATPTAKRLYEALREQEQTPAELSRSTGLPLHEVLSSLTMLELLGAVVCTAGQRYALRYT